MDAKELRNGVLVYRTRNQWTLEKQEEELIVWDDGIWYRIGECIDSIECFSGIPITANTLVTLLGFDIEKDRLKKGDFSVYFINISTNGMPPEEKITVSYKSSVIELMKKEVHFLQNLHLFLTGTDLEPKTNTHYLTTKTT